MDCFDAPLGEQVLDVALAEAKALVEPDCVLDDGRWELALLAGIGGSAGPAKTRFRSSCLLAPTGALRATENRRIDGSIASLATTPVWDPGDTMEDDVRGLSVQLLAMAAGTALAIGSDTQPLGLTRLQNSVYACFEGIDVPVTLDAGHWEGEPPQPGSASVPRVDFLGDLVARGDLDGDGEDEAAVMLTTNFGGTGVYSYVAVVDQLAAENRSLDTRTVGDRIQLRGMRIEEGHLVLDIVF